MSKWASGQLDCVWSKILANSYVINASEQCLSRCCRSSKFLVRVHIVYPGFVYDKLLENCAWYRSGNKSFKERDLILPDIINLAVLSYLTLSI